MLNSISKKVFFAGYMSNNRTSPKQTFSVEASQSLPKQNLSIFLKSGMAWITSNGNDAILNAGDSMFIKANKHAAVISCLTELPITVEVEVI